MICELRPRTSERQAKSKVGAGAVINAWRTPYWQSNSDKLENWTPGAESVRRRAETTMQDILATFGVYILIRVSADAGNDHVT